MTGVLVKHFKLQEFKSWQLEVIKAVLERRNAFVLQPTGSGKSLCFQFPALVTKKATIVITPTLSLMSDQCSALQARGIRATYLGSTQKDKDVEKRVCTGEYDIIYTTPEKKCKTEKEEPPKKECKTEKEVDGKGRKKKKVGRTLARLHVHVLTKDTFV